MLQEEKNTNLLTRATLYPRRLMVFMTLDGLNGTPTGANLEILTRRSKELRGHRIASVSSIRSSAISKKNNKTGFRTNGHKEEAGVPDERASGPCLAPLPPPVGASERSNNLSHTGCFPLMGWWGIAKPID